MTTEVLDKTNKKVGTLDLSDKIFGAKWNSRLVHQVLTSEMSNLRKPSAHVKDRSEVRGGGKKPWAQKHTGRSRHGSSRSPLWIGGGVTHGPRKERNYEKKINVKMKHAALRAVLSKKLKEHEIKIIDSFDLKTVKTKEVSSFVKHFFEKNPSILFVPAPSDKSFVRAARNIPKTKIVMPQGLTLSDCLNHKYVFFDKRAVTELKF